MLFLADKGYEDWEKAKWTRQYLQGTAVSLKKGAEITPPVFHFFKKENGGLKYDFQTADISNRKIVVEQRFCVWGVIYRKRKSR